MILVMAPGQADAECRAASRCLSRHCNQLKTAAGRQRLCGTVSWPLCVTGTQTTHVGRMPLTSSLGTSTVPFKLKEVAVSCWARPAILAAWANMLWPLTRVLRDFGTTRGGGRLRGALGGGRRGVRGTSTVSMDHTAAATCGGPQVLVVGSQDHSNHRY
jgi:hypothetical protein